MPSILELIDKKQKSPSIADMIAEKQTKEFTPLDTNIPTTYDPAEAPIPGYKYKPSIIERGAVSAFRQTGIPKLLPVEEAGRVGGAAVPSPAELSQMPWYKKMPEYAGAGAMEMVKFAPMYGALKSIGLIGKLGPHPSVIQKALEWGKLFAGTEAIEQTGKWGLEKISPAGTFEVGGKEAVLKSFAIGTLLGLGLQGLEFGGRKIFKPIKQALYRKALGLPRNYSEEQLRTAVKTLGEKYKAGTLNKTEREIVSDLEKGAAERLKAARGTVYRTKGPKPPTGGILQKYNQAIAQAQKAGDTAAVQSLRAMEQIELGGKPAPKVKPEAGLRGVKSPSEMEAFRKEAAKIAPEPAKQAQPPAAPKAQAELAKQAKPAGKGEVKYVYHGTSEGAFRRIREQGITGKEKYFSADELYAQSYADRKGLTKGRMLRIAKTPDIVPDERIPEKGDFKTSRDISPQEIEVKVGDKWLPIQEYVDEAQNIMPLAKQAKPAHEEIVEKVKKYKGGIVPEEKKPPEYIKEWLTPEQVRDFTEGAAEQERIVKAEAGKVEIEPGTREMSKIQAHAHIIAKDKGLISSKGKPTPNYRRFAKAMTGKSSMKKMSNEEAENFVEMLDLLPVDKSGRARIPTTKSIITKELADKINDFTEIGIMEKVRPAWRVFEKIGLYKEVWEPAFEKEMSVFEEHMKFREEARKMKKTVGSGKEVSKKLFRALNNPGVIKLSPAEQKVVDWGKKFYEDWAERLKLPPEKIRQNYITHIFEKQITEDLRAKHPLDPDLIRALDFITPKTIFNPYLEKRLGKKVGLKEDFWSALEAYEGKALKKYYYEPLIKRIRVYNKYLPPNSARYLRDFIKRITGQPLSIDREVTQTLREAAEEISKMPGGENLAKYLRSGNSAGMISYNLAGIYYEAWLGLRPASAIKNLSQHGLVLAETGPVAFMKGMATSGKTRSDLLAKSKVLKSRKVAYLPSIDQTYINSLESKRRKATMAMFRLADRKNVSDAFLAGYHEAKAKGLPDEEAIKRGDEVAAKTQYLYTKFAGSHFMQSSPGRFLGVLTTWPENWAEIMNDWIRGKPSRVYSEYEKSSGKKVNPTNFLSRRKSLFLYMSLVSLAMLLEKKTRLKARYYTGWTSWKSLADIASGKLPGLTIPRSVAQITAGVALGDKKMIKQGWKEVDPRRFIVIARELNDIISGKKDWLNLFVYLEPKKKKDASYPEGF